MRSLILGARAAGYDVSERTSGILRYCECVSFTINSDSGVPATTPLDSLSLTMPRAHGFSPPRQRAAKWAFVAAVHVALLVAWWHYASPREGARSARRVLVSLISEPTPPRIPPVVAKSAPRVRHVTAPPPLLAAPPETPDALAIAIVPIPAPAPIAALESLPVAMHLPPARQAASAGTAPSFSAAYLSNPAPAYPSSARRNGEQGTVVLRVLVNAAGDPERVEINHSSGFDRLDRAALDAVRQWKFVPGRRDGEAITAWVNVPLMFSLAS